MYAQSQSILAFTSHRDVLVTIYALVILCSLGLESNLFVVSNGFVVSSCSLPVISTWKWIFKIYYSPINNCLYITISSHSYQTWGITWCSTNEKISRQEHKCKIQAMNPMGSTTSHAEEHAPITGPKRNLDNGTHFTSKSSPVAWLGVYIYWGMNDSKWPTSMMLADLKPLTAWSSIA